MKEGINLFLENLLSEFASLLPKLILALAIILIGFLVGRIVEKLVKRFILYLNQSLNAQLQKRLLDVDLKSSASFISKAFFWFILLISFLTCIQVLELDFINSLFSRVVGYLPNVLVAVIIIFFGIISGRLLGDLIKSAASKTGVANGKYLGRAVRYLILFVAIVIAVDQLGVDIAFLTNLFIIILSSILFGAALAFGLGARTSISNILGSYYVRKSYELGSKIKLEDLEGTIVKINDHSIALETKSGTVLIPAKDFSESRVTIIKEI